MNWIKINLGDICELQNGYAFKSSEYTNDGYFLMRITNVQQGFISNHNPKFVSIPANSKLKQFILNEGDILISLTGDVGRVGVVYKHNLPAALNQRVARIIIKNQIQIDKNFLFNLLNSDSMRNKIESLGHGAAQLNVSTKDILSIKVSIPPLEIQKKIVAKLDAIFVEIDKAMSATQKNVLNARMLTKATINKLVGDFPKDCFVKFGSVCDFVRGPFGGSLTKSIFVEEGIAVYEQQHPINNQFDNFRYYITENKFNEMKRFEVFSGDLIMSCSGVTLGKIAIVPKGAPKGIINQALLKISPSNVIRKEYLKAIMESEYFQSILWDYSGGAAQPNVPSVKVIKDFLIPVPSLEEQDIFIDKVLNLLNYQLDEGYKNKLHTLKKLKQSTLRQAFSGELIKV